MEDAAMPQPIAIIGTGCYLPGDPVSPDRVETVLGPIPGLPDRLGSRAARIGAEVIARSGVRTRYFAIDPATRAQTETNASMAERAIRAALAASGESPETIDLLVCASPMADYYCPPTSALVQDRLGIRRCTEIEIHSNCTGAPKGLQVALDMLRTGRHRRAAVVYTQLSSAFLRGEFFNPASVRLENLALRWMLSDGAGAMILDRAAEGLSLMEAYVESRGGGRKPGMIGGLSGAFASEVPLNGSAVYPMLHASGQHHVWQDIGEVNREAPRQLIEGLGEMLEAAGIEGRDVTHFLLGIPGRHFMTEAMVAFFVDRIGGEPARAPFDTEHFGYCGGATMFIQFDRLVRSGRLQRGELVAAYLEESSKWMSGGFLARA
jgi:3-oxoacyl-[acyl-carrier-protein] synthase-3